MPPNIASSFPDLLTADFAEVFFGVLQNTPSKLEMLFTKADKGPRGDQYTVSDVGTQTDWDDFDDVGSVQYSDIFQGYDVTATHKEFVKGFSIQRKLIDDEMHSIFSGRPRSMGDSYMRTREKHGARIFENAFVNDTFFYNHTEGVPLCSNSHTTTTGASTASGFDNLITDALSATAVASARIQMRKFRGDQAEIVNIRPDEIWIPLDLEEKAFEITKSSHKVDTDLNNRNFHEGSYQPIAWEYMEDVNNWFMCDSVLRKRNVFWIDRIGVEFKMVEEFDTFIHKWRGYSRYSNLYNDWRWVLGSQVS
jgi:phage major head subunit gpT-like protein